MPQAYLHQRVVLLVLLLHLVPYFRKTFRRVSPGEDARLQV